MAVIERLSALEILDSRGRPTVSARCKLGGGPEVSASVPSGASTGKAEANELRDEDPKRYGGMGCRSAVANINGPIAAALAGKEWADQAGVDRELLVLDGTKTKWRLGANAILAVSIVFARAMAALKGIPLYEHLRDVPVADMSKGAMKLPRLTVNLFSGGKHAGGQVPIQDVLIVPASHKTIDESLAMTYAVYQAASSLCRENYGSRALVADEGGLAPPFSGAESMLEDAVSSIRQAGLELGKDVYLAVDVAASHFYSGERYELGAAALTSEEMIEKIDGWVKSFPIVSVEDGLAEDDWKNWPALRETLAGRALVVGDDLLCTNQQRIARAIEAEAADALLLKVNQIGTLSEAADAYAAARQAGWMVTISARSGETEDNWLADLAVGWGGDQIKIGSITRSERLAKYNRLLDIEAQTHDPLEPWPNSTRKLE